MRKPKFQPGDLVGVTGGWGKPDNRPATVIATDTGGKIFVWIQKTVEDWTYNKILSENDLYHWNHQ